MGGASPTGEAFTQMKRRDRMSHPIAPLPFSGNQAFQVELGSAGKA
jgi:hypothetical protein